MNNLQDMIDSIEDADQEHLIQKRNNSKKEKICNKCHQSGHFANKCPVVSDKKKAKMKCYICGQTGHNRNSCPGIDDDGVAQSTYKGNSTCKNNTGEKKKKGKDKVRAQKMMRAKKKERGQSIDEKETKGITFPDAAIEFHDMLTSKLPEFNESEVNYHRLLAGFISHCVLSSDKSYSLSFKEPVPPDTPGLKGYSVGISPNLSTLWLNHIDINCGEDFVLCDILNKLGTNPIAMGPIGLDYREQTTARNPIADQLEVFRRQLAMTANSTPFAGSLPRFIALKAIAPESEDTSTIFDITEKKDTNSFDRDFFKILHDSEHLRQESCPTCLVICLADCGLQFSTISALITVFPSNLYFSLDGRLTHSKQKLLKEYAFDIPLSKLVFATMSPNYPIAPACCDGVSFDTSNSTHILFIAEVLATLKNIPLDEVLEKCLENSSRILA